MDIYIGLLISFGLLIYSVVKNIFIGDMLIVCWIIFLLISLKKGYKLHEILKMSYDGSKKSFVVLKMFIMIGAVVGVWMASGTIPSIVYYCINYISPSVFVLSAFIVCCITSALLGTSLGTASIVGIPLMIIARTGNINLNMVAGAIISGAYFGDRCSFMSSSASLVSNLTETNIFTNIRNMIYSSIIPFTLTAGFYYILSKANPLYGVNSGLSVDIAKTFNVGVIMFLPAVIIIILSLFKVNIKISIFVSIIVASIIAVFIQKFNLLQVINYMIFGFKLSSNSPLQNIIKGGGIVSMLKAGFVIFVSCAIAGIFNGLKAFDNLSRSIVEMKLTRCRLFAVTSVVSLATAAFGCNQSISVVMTDEIMKNCYNSNKYEFALDIENSAILLAALVPWNIAAMVPTTSMNVSMTGYLPYAVYLYILPILYYIHYKYGKHIVGKNIYNHLQTAIRNGI